MCLVSVCGSTVLFCQCDCWQISMPRRAVCQGFSTILYKTNMQILYCHFNLCTDAVNDQCAKHYIITHQFQNIICPSCDLCTHLVWQNLTSLKTEGRCHYIIFLTRPRNIFYWKVSVSIDPFRKVCTVKRL